MRARHVVLLYALCLAPPASASPRLSVERVGRQLRLASMKAKVALGRWVAPVVGYVQLYTPLRYSVEPYQAEVSATLSRGTRLEPKDVADLDRRGFRAIVAVTAEDTSDEAQALALGMRFLRVPVIDNTVPTHRQMTAFLDFVSHPANQPVYVHCQRGEGRTGIAVAAYRMAVQGWDLGHALAEARRYGLRLRHQVEYLRQFSQDLNAGRIPGYGAARPRQSLGNP